MAATKTELQQAAAIKQAASDDPEINIDNISDFEFLQHAIVAKDNVDKALLRIKRMQVFKDRYGILLDGSYEEALRDLNTMCRSFPDFFLSIGEAKKGVQVLSFDFAQYKAHPLDSEEGYAVCMRAFFYSIQAAQMDLDSIRAGVQILGDFTGLSWDNFSMEGEKRAAQLYSNCYPMRLTGMALMGAHPLIRLFYSVLKLFLSKKVKQIASFPRDRDEYIKMANISGKALPKEWGGSQTRKDMIAAIQGNLQERYKNIANFTL